MLAGAILLLLASVFGRKAIIRYLPFASPQLNGHTVPTPVDNPTANLKDFDPLPSTTGQPLSLADFRGKVVLLYFGYTFCPDVCPATLSDLKSVRQQLTPEQREQVQVVMITVDPERDTLDRLQEYLAFFDPSFIGLHGTIEETQAAAAKFAVFFEKQPSSEATGYLLDHTASFSVIDKQGYWRAIYSFGTPAEDVVADMQILTREK